MILYVWSYNPTSKVFNKTAVIDYATSIIWVKRFNDAGEFELYLRASDELLEMFNQTEVILTRDDDSAVMVVEKIKLTTNDETGDYLIISGRSSECFLARRIVPKQRTFTNTTAEYVIRLLIDENIIDPRDSARRIALITLGSYQGYTENINKQITGKDLLTSISDICKDMNYGFKFTFTDGSFVFNLYKGTDRSYNQTVNPYVIFSPEFENLGNTEYSVDRTTHYNSIYVAGEGEGINRKIVHLTAIETPSPNQSLLLKEKWVDSRNTSSNDGQITSTEYNSLLMQQGYEEIALSKDTHIFNGEILNYNTYTYGVDYNLGDTVQIVNEYGITGTATVTEITEVEDDTGYRLYPTLSEWSV